MDTLIPKVSRFSVERKQKTVTIEARKIVGYYTQNGLAELLGISVNTLKSRFKLHNWTYAEYLAITHASEKITSV